MEGKNVYVHVHIPERIQGKDSWLVGVCCLKVPLRSVIIFQIIFFFLNASAKDFYRISLLRKMITKYYNV